MVKSPDPARILRLVAFHLERTGEPTYRVQAFRRAAATVDDLAEGELDERIRTGTLTQLPGIGKVTAGLITEVAGGSEPEYLLRVRERAAEPDGGELRAALRGDCHTHSDWSDGGSPVHEMANAARELGHEWMVLTDHSPRLKVARGLSTERLRQQLDLVAELNSTLAPFRILTGIEVDILTDGTLDQDPDLLASLDLVVASLHSALRMPAPEMTRRMVAAVRDPNVDVLGHCTGRLVSGKRGRPESTFDAEAVFEACQDNDVAVEINSRPERQDPPRRLIRLAAELGCRFAIDSDAHAPGQLAWQSYGCVRATECGVGPDQVINSCSADQLADWTGSRR
ncbi:PHP domain-containing protein [Amycolatopsis palatopharyngis]|uniref:PHP domain-containing protein n=1 Tax=Amycolatopsis palatopharyngis TaxID=187982 RepID=UPI000E252D8E|nr:PHP domain-containing protein [Amycolatopsis palatopharyngis]